MSIREELAKMGESAVVVLCGGPGGEREVSLDSGETAHLGLIRAGVPNRKVVVPEEAPDAFLENLDCRVAVMMLHGEFGEGGAAQEILERRGVGYNGSDAATCRLAMDKDASKKEFVRRGIPTPRWVLGREVEAAAREVAVAGLRYPLFVKPNFGGSSVGASRVNEPAMLAEAVRAALATDRLALIEELVPGRELTVGWFEGRVLPVIELLADGVFYDYRAKYQSDATRYICPAELSGAERREVEDCAAAVASCLGARDLARVDIMLGPDGPMVLELNSLPGFTGHSLFPMAAARAGIPLEEVCLRLAELAAGRTGKP